ncbi:MAG: SDR family oxidoreductase [Candidatus Eremiobacteraeota bacterium]|nr:SDR family oxidoreductase [Candidatus Eremiobacteraeota bacterium]
MSNKIDLSGRRAVVTGGASGIGLETSRRLLACGCAALSIWDRDEAALQQARATLPSSANVFTRAVDVADPAAVENAARVANDAMGGIEILVNSAGITGPNQTIWDYPLDAWRSVIDINLNGIFYCLRAVVPIMRAARYGRVVNIASIAGKEGNPNASAYSASKAGVIALTKSAGKELVHDGVIVNCIAPAAVETPMFSQMTKEFVDFMLSKIPMGRFGKPEEIATLIAWLCSDDVSFSTGATYDISGGRATY